MQIFSHAKTNNTYRWNNADRTKIRSIERCQQVLYYCIRLNGTLGRRSNRSPSIFRFVGFVDLHAPALSLPILVSLKKKINMANHLMKSLLLIIIKLCATQVSLCIYNVCKDANDSILQHIYGERDPCVNSAVN